MPDGVALDDRPTLALTSGADVAGAKSGTETATVNPESSRSDAAVGDATGGAADSKPQLLNIPIKCYTCKQPFRELHGFYDQLCPTCAELNFRKRTQTADLSNKVCLITGCRCADNVSILVHDASAMHS